MGFARSRRTRLLLALGLAAVALLGLKSWTESRQRLEIPRAWARLAAYPTGATSLRATTSGNAFSRSFRVTFRAPPSEVELWLRASPGTREAVPVRPAPGRRRFAIKPGGGAQKAEVDVDDARGEVVISVAWS